MNNISKKFLVSILTEETKVVNSNISVFTLEDIEITAQLLESFNPITKEKIPKDITGCEISVVAYRRKSDTTVRQEFGVDEFGGEISILSALEGKIKFKPNDLIMECDDKVLLQFKLSDSNEIVITQPWTITIKESVENGNIIIPEDKVRTLEDLDSIIIESRNTINTVNKEIGDTRARCSELVENVEGSLDATLLRIEQRASSLEERIESLDNKMKDNRFITQHRLSPKGDRSTVRFCLGIKGHEAKRLINSTIEYHIVVKYEQSSVVEIGRVYGYILSDTNNIPYVYLGNSQEVSVSPKPINSVFKFNEEQNKIYAETLDYKITIDTDIDSKYLNNCSCYVVIKGQGILIDEGVII